MQRTMTKSKHSQSVSSSQSVKRGLNTSALLISFLVFALLAGGGYLWYRIASSRNSKALYDYAEHCAETKDYAAAATQFARYVQFRPDDAAARVRLAETYDLGYSKLGHAQRAIELYHEALGVASEPQKASIHARLGELLLDTQQDITAADEADAVLKQDPKNSQALSLRARAFYGQARQGTFRGRPEIVGTSFETALANDPGDRNAQVLRVADREKTADQIIDRLVAARADHPEVYLARYQYRVQYHLPGADADLAEARRLNPKNLDVLLTSADAFRREAATVAPSPAAPDKVRSLRDGAIANYEQAIAVAPGDYRAYLGLGEIQSELGQPKAAIDAWNRGLQSAPATASLFDMVLANALVGQGRLDEAEKHLDRLSRQFEKPEQGQKVSFERALFLRKYQLVRANYLRGRNQLFNAIALAHEVASGPTATPEELNVATEAWTLVADAYSSLGRWAEAADAFEKVMEIVPNSARYRALAASAWTEANQPDRAVRALRQALSFGDGSELRLALAAALFRQTLTAPKGNRDWTAVQAALTDAGLANSKQPLQDPWRLALLEADIAQSRESAEGRRAEGVSEAAAIYRNIKLDEKAQQKALPAIAMAFERLGLHEDADRTAAAWEKTVTPQQAPLLRAQLAASRTNYDEARRLVQANLQNLSPFEQASARRFLVRLSLDKRDWKSTRTELDSLTDLGARDLDLLFAYAELAREFDQPAEVEYCVGKFNEIEGAGNRYEQFLQASDILAHAKSPDSPQLRDARKMAEQLVHQCPDWPAGLLLRARTLEVEGQSEAAIEAYRDTLRHGAMGIDAYERLIDLLSRAGRTAEAEIYLDAMREQSSGSEIAAVFESQMATHQGDREKALEIVRREAMQHPKNAAIQLSLGQMLLATNRASEAVAAFQRAVEIAPDSLQTIFSLSLCLIEAKQPERAREVVAKLAVRKDLPEAQKDLVIAEVDEFLGDLPAAREQYQAACNAPQADPAVRLRMAEFLLRSPQDGDSAAGEKLLRAIVADSPNNAPARRTLAGLLASRGGETSWNEARKLLRDSPNGADSSASNRRAEALLLIQRGGLKNRQQAWQILSELVLRADADMNDRTMLAKLENEDGQVEQARGQYAIVASQKSPAVDSIVAYSDFLLRHGPSEEADVQIRRLEKLAPDDLAALSLRVRWLHAQHQDGDISRLVEGFAERRQEASMSVDERAQHRFAIGALYELTEQFSAAEHWYRLLLEVQPDRFEPLAGVVAKQKRGGEAVSICLDAAKHESTALPAKAVCALRATGAIEEKDFLAAEPLIAAAEKGNPDPEFLAMLAAVRILEGRTDEAITLYHKVLAARPQDVRALNNLATLLGEQPAHVKESLEVIDRALNLAGPQGWLLETKGQILLNDGRIGESVVMLQEAATLDESDPRVLLHLAEAYRLAGKLDQAKKAFDDAQTRHLPQQLLTPVDRKLIKELDEKLRG